MGGWMIAAPHLLAFTDVAPARWAYATTGMIVAMLSVPGLVSLNASGDRMGA
jgi:hypothetical protein